MAVTTAGAIPSLPALLWELQPALPVQLRAPRSAQRLRCCRPHAPQSLWTGLDTASAALAGTNPITVGRRSSTWSLSRRSKKSDGVSWRAISRASVSRPSPDRPTHSVGVNPRKSWIICQADRREYVRLQKYQPFPAFSGSPLSMTNQDQPAGRRPSKIAAALQNALTKIHSVLYRSSNGVIGGRIVNSPVLLLTVTGRRSGKQRTVPLLYLMDGRDVVLVASNGGAARHPTWWLGIFKPRLRLGYRLRVFDAELRRSKLLPQRSNVSGLG